MGPPLALDIYIVINKSKSPTTPAAQQGWPGRQKGNRIQRKKKQKQQQQLDPWSIWGGGEVIRIHTHTHPYTVYKLDICVSRERENLYVYYIHCVIIIKKYNKWPSAWI
jgi:hypothetical protein